MKYLYQTISHNPDAGQWGNCMQTAIACLMDMDPDDVPHFYEGGVNGDVFDQRVRNFLRTKGLTLFTIPYSGELSGILATIGHYNPNVTYLLSGSTGADTNHVVICRGGEIIHNPLPANTPFIGPCTPSGFWWVEILTPILED